MNDNTPNAEARYRARFYFNPNSIPMVSGDTHYIFQGYAGTSTSVIRCAFGFYSGVYQVRRGLVNDSGTWLYSSWETIANAYHSIEVDWRAASAAGANDGGLTVWIDGVQKAGLTGVDNDTRCVDRARLGATGGVDTETREPTPSMLSNPATSPILVHELDSYCSGKGTLKNEQDMLKRYVLFIYPGPRH